MASCINNELAIDLALSRLNVVALKASQNEPVTLEERSLAQSLRDTLTQKLNLLTRKTELTDATVPEKAMREELQKTLTSLSAHAVKNTTETNNRLKLFINLINELSRDEVSATDVQRCLGALIGMDKRKPSTLP